MPSNNRSRQQPWISSAPFDIAFILAPPIVACLFVFFYYTRDSQASVGPIAWLAIVVCIDVAHVYGSLFRTYLDPELKTRKLLWIVPLFCWIFGASLYFAAPIYFWRALAYLAVFHFVRQQYGFAMLYSRGETDRSRFSRKLDQVLIYTATLYPLLFWHTHSGRQFNWFTEGDFLTIDSPLLADLGFLFYCGIIALYICKEIASVIKNRFFNIPRNLLIFGTLISWYIGIVWLNNDLAFTVTNVVTHGVPYLALVWIYGNRKATQTSAKPKFRFSIFALSSIPLFIALLIFLAYFEEGLWDSLVWREHMQFFSPFTHLNQLNGEGVLLWVVPLLALPQSTHYIFDAFLWRSKGPESNWKKTFAIQSNKLERFM